MPRSSARKFIVLDEGGQAYMMSGDDSRIQAGHGYTAVGEAVPAGKPARQANGFMARPYAAAGRTFFVYTADWSASEVHNA